MKFSVDDLFEQRLRPDDVEAVDDASGWVQRKTANPDVDRALARVQ